MSKLVSVIIPTYNREKKLKKALDSVLNQSYSNWEIIIIDNNSTDKTDKVVSSIQDRRIRFYKINNNGIIAASRNLGINLARGEYIAFLDSDDWWTKDKLEISIKFLQNGADLVYHDLYSVKKPNQLFFIRKFRGRILKKPIFKDLSKNSNPILNSSVVSKLELLKKIDGFSENKELVTGEDYECWLRLSKITDKFEKIPKCLGFNLIGNDNSSHPEFIISIFKYLEFIYPKEGFDSEKHVNNNYSNYIRGISYYKLKKYYDAKKSFNLIVLNKYNFFIYLKTIYMHILILLNILKEKII